jgi:hypothetical protein
LWWFGYSVEQVGCVFGTVSGATDLVLSCLGLVEKGWIWKRVGGGTDGFFWNW